MYARKCRFACAAVLLAGLQTISALTTIAPVLTNATWSGDQFQFKLRGETNVGYILESSSNLRTWTRALTNSDPQTTRTITVPAASSQTFWRVRPVPAPVFEYAVLAQGTVNLGGSGRIDSFNSTNDLESTGGQYDPAKATDRAMVATTSRTATALSVGNMAIYGSVSTGPGATVTIGPNGNVGSAAFNDSPPNNGMIEPGHHRDDIRALLPAAFVPTDFAPSALPLNVFYPPMMGGTNYNYAILQDGDYRHLGGNFSLSSGQKMLINARARVQVMGSTTVSGTGCIVLGPNASIEWYATGAVNIGGGGCINNSGRATNFSIVCLTSESIGYSGTAPFIGTIYAPRSSVTLSGTSGAVGAVVCTNFTLTGAMSLHFDENLKRAGPSL
jgi:hypothetical protein